MKTHITVFLSSLVFTTFAHAQIAVFSSPPNAPSSVAETSPGSGIYNVSVSWSEEDRPVTFYVVANRLTDQIQTLTATLQSSQTVLLYAGSPAGSYPSSYKISTIDTITRAGAGTGNFVLFDIRTSSQIGSFTSYSMISLDIGGDVQRDITATGSGIVSLLVQGNLLGSVKSEASNGMIDTIGVTGAIGVPGSSTRPSIIGTARVKRVTAASINANISATATNARISTVESTTGDIEGSISAPILGLRTNSGNTAYGTIRAARDLAANMTFTNEVRDEGGTDTEIRAGRDFVSGKTLTVTNRVFANADIIVGRNLAGSIVVTNADASTNGLRSQVIANADNGTGTWTGSVSTGGISLSGSPYYSTITDSIGDGAVGLVPFRAHTADSGVVYGDYTGDNTLLQSDYDVVSTTTNLVELEFYGPVRLYPSNATEIPVTVIRGAGIEGCEENVLDASSSFTAVVSGRKVFLRRASGGTTPPHGTYSVVPKITGPSTLVCDGITGNVPVDPEQAFTFNIGRDCNGNGVIDIAELATEDDNEDGLIDTCVTPVQGQDYFCLADFNYDSFVDFFDYDDYLLCFECNACPPLRDADINGDLFVDFFDYEAFVAAFEIGCPT